MQTLIRTKYDRENHPSPGIHFDAKKDKSLTQQSDIDSADINKIMARFEKTGMLPTDMGERKPMYGDFTQLKDYHTMLVAVRNTERVFGLLPASVRNRFKNNPQELINFLEDSRNNEEAVSLGLKDRRVLLTAFDLDGKTPTTPAERAALDKLTPAQKEARVKQLSDLYAAGIDPLTGERIPPVINNEPAPAAPGQPANPAA